MSSLDHPKFGKIAIYRSQQARSLKISIALNGQLRITAPRRLSIKTIQRTINSSHQEIKQLFNDYYNNNPLKHGQKIGKSHNLLIKDSAQELTITIDGPFMVIHKPKELSLDTPITRQQIQFFVNKILRKEAKNYLPKRLAVLAKQHGYHYNKVQLSNARTRWGSCSSYKTISLNINLMQLPFELIDYVLVHELTHTVEMNHGLNFWSLLEKKIPDYKQRQRALKKYNTSI